MMANQIEILKREGEFGSTFYTVIVDGLFADRLGPDEALGAVASAMFGPKDKRAMFMHSYEEWLEREKIFDRGGIDSPVALLTTDKS